MSLISIIYKNSTKIQKMTNYVTQACINSLIDCNFNDLQTNFVSLSNLT
jgi:hypothetical protein